MFLTTLFIILQNGLYIENISIPNVKIEKLYIKWNEKIDVSVETVSITKNKFKNANEFDYDDIARYLLVFSHYGDLLGALAVEKIHFNDVSATLNYKEGEDGFLAAESPLFEFQSRLCDKSNILNVHIEKLQSLKRNVRLSGDVFFSSKDAEFYSDLKINVNDDLDANVFAKLNANALTYKLRINKDVKNIRYLIETLNLPKEVAYWALDAIEMERVGVQNASGFIDFKNPDQTLENIKINATVHNLNYAYNTKLDPIRTQSTELEFKQGVLFIRPNKAYSQGMFLDKSWLKIDFTKKEELLTLYLLFDGKLNKEMLNVLKTYKINIPFLQKSGNVKTNLKLAVNLRTIEVDAQGDFFAQRANFHYLGLNFDIYDAYVRLNNYDVKIDDMKVAYGDIATSFVDVDYDARTSKGSIIFNVINAKLPQMNLSLDKAPLKIVYDMSPNNDTINVKKSHWKRAQTEIKIDSIVAPFDLDKLLLSVPTTYFDIKDVSNGFISGIVNFKKLTASLNADILKFQYKNTKLNESNTQLKLEYDKKIKITSKEKISFNVDDLIVDLRGAAIEIYDERVHIKDLYLSVGDLLYAKINSLYDVNNQVNDVDLEYVRVKKDAKQIYGQSDLKLRIEKFDDELRISAEKLKTKFTINDEEWKLEISELDKIAKNSDALQRLKIKEGNATISQRHGVKTVKFGLNLEYAYKFLVADGKEVEKYEINGEINDKKINLKINDNIDIKIDETTQVNASGIGVNVPELLRFANDINISTNESGNSKVLVNATNSYLYLGNDRKIVSDEIDIQYDNKITTAQLKHKTGSAGLKIENNNFHLYGNKFNDEFMEEIFSLSKFKGGELEFSVKGAIKDYSGAFYIRNTTMIDYRLMNNVLAFVNTVPSLMTFSLPGYDKNGLNVEFSYAKFTAKNGVFDVSDFFIDSKEIDVVGKGVANVKEDSIDATLNLKTDLASAASKIPLVGYILFDGDSVSTTLSVTGKLSNPDVRSLLAKEIIVAPLNIIKRTILLPFKLFGDIVKDENGSE